ncbi:MAG: tetratricopeptide repeat protein [Flavisolibacter sp.]|nr:tetratricopeptide repeat protein [Flavisolibacter sp.]
MNKRYTYLVLIFLFVAGCLFVVLRYTNGLKSKMNAFYPLQERRGTTALAPDWAATKDKASKLIRIVRENPDDIKSTLTLATIYVKESRITGNSMYYDAAAMKYVNDVLAKEPENYEALVLKSLIYLSQHHFAEGLAIAEKAVKSGPGNAFSYGLLVDGNVEMGNYKAAVENAEKMVSLRPDLRSYSRISYLREIHGDNSGAIEAMHSAVKAGLPGDESTSWARIQLARLYENTGDLKSAEMHYTIALDERPGYPYAIAGLGHIAMGNGDYKKAIVLYQQADTSINDYSFKEQLANLYLLTGDKKKAGELMQSVIEGMTRDAKKGEEDESIGHYVDRELALAYVMTNNYDKALQHALAEYNRRPDNIDVNETVAWVYYKKGDFSKALPFVNAALRTNCKNPTLLIHAGLIYAKNNQQDKAKALLQEALQHNPNIDVQLKAEGTSVLQAL